jgi:hypothetical protein
MDSFPSTGRLSARAQEPTNATAKKIAYRKVVKSTGGGKVARWRVAAGGPVEGRPYQQGPDTLIMGGGRAAAC